MVTVARLYAFIAIADPDSLRARLVAAGARLGLLGTLIVAGEGVNGTVAGAADAVADFVACLGLPGLVPCCARSNRMPFRRLKIKVKPEIVTLGVAVDARRTGRFVAPRDWHAVLDDPYVTLIDLRNGFEVALGSFDGAIDPQTSRFGEFPTFVARALDPARHRRVAMFCTGGIRCEKASALLLAQGFPEVLQLRGGILGYLDDVPPGERRWRGDCFVFDERRVVNG